MFFFPCCRFLPRHPAKPFAASLLRLFIGISLAMLGLNLALAAESPPDTNRIESLTVEDAKRLAETFPGVKVEFEDEGNHSEWWSCLPLQGLTTLDVKTATALAAFKGDAVLLTGLTTFDLNTAKAMAAFGGDVVLQKKVRKTFFAKHPLSSKTVLGWAVVAGGELPEVTFLDAATANSLADYKGTLWLAGLTTLSGDAANALARHKGWLILSGLTTLSTEAAKALSQHEGWLRLDGLTTLSDEAAKALSKFSGVGLFLNGLTTLDAGTAKGLAEFKGQSLSLNGLTTLDADAAIGLAGCKAKTLCLGGLTSLDAATAKALAAVEKWDGNLSAITALDTPDSVAIAQALATRKGPLAFPNLEKISPKTLSALIEKEDVEIPLIETLELIPEPDGSVTEDFIIPDALGERQKRQRQ